MRYRVLLATVLFCSGLVAGEGGTLQGSVKAEGDIEGFAPIPVPPARANRCKCQTAPNAVEVDPATKGLRWAIVRVMGVKAPEPAVPFAMPVIDQANCTYLPRAVVVPVDGTVDFLNPEGIIHAIGLIPLEGDNPPGNFVQAPNVPRLTAQQKHFAAAGLHKLSCAPHSWMTGLIAIHDPRFAAVTPADGTFEIKGIPPGKYTVMVNHETFEKTMEVEIKAGSVTPLEVKHTYKK